MKKIIIISLAILAVAIGGGYYYFTGTPTYSLYQLKKSIQAHDSATFNKYVDTDRVIDGLLTDAMKGTDADSNNNPFAGLAQTFLLSMKETLKSSINKNVEDISNGKGDKITGLRIKSVTKEGKSANVTLENSNSEEIHLSMINVPEGYWRIVSVNLDDFKKISPDTLSTSEKSNGSNEEKKISTNAKFGDKISIGDGWFIQVEKPEIYAPSKDSYTHPKDGDVFMTVSLQYFNENNTGDTVSPENLTLKDTENQNYKITTWGGKKPEISYGDMVPAHDSLKGYITFEMPKSAEITKAVYSNSLATIIIE